MSSVALAGGTGNSVATESSCGRTTSSPLHSLSAPLTRTHREKSGCVRCGSGDPVIGLVSLATCVRLTISATGQTAMSLLSHAMRSAMQASLFRGLFSLRLCADKSVKPRLLFTPLFTAFVREMSSLFV